ncbi:MAG TPA: ferritin family protein [Terriglobia bacterium]|nr:ferritin family protein [Terriglobia bacterium]
MATRDLKFKSLSKWAVLGSMTVVMFASLAWMGEAPAQSKTVMNLQAAYTAEANAYVRYLAFAERAQENEFGEAASLFRAAGCAEHIHLKNLAALMRKLGYEPVIRVDTPVVKTTKENLRSSAEVGEAYERDTLYPEFVKEARTEGNDEAVRVFQHMVRAEAQHATLFKAALGNLQKMDATNRVYYVCSMCGYTSERAVKPCPGCGHPEPTYEEMF